MQKRSFGFYQSINFLITMVVLIAPTQAAERNYSSRQLPSIYELELDGQDLLVKLGGSYSQNAPLTTSKNARPFHRLAPVLRLHNGKWSMDGKWDCNDCSSPPYSPTISCPENIPSIPAMEHPDIHPCSDSPGAMCASGVALRRMGFGDEMINPEAKWDYGINEFPSQCYIDDEVVWFGVNFYGGEGFIGMGGIGKYDRNTNKVEVRRTKELTTYGVKRIAKSGEWILAATTPNTEGGGTPPSLGLIRYNWSDGRFESFLDNEAGLCGFVVYDLLRIENNIWVATDIGLSRWNESEERWYNYLPKFEGGMNVPEVTCDLVYRQLLGSLSKDREDYFDMTYAYSYYDLLLKNLMLYRKEFMKGYAAMH